MSTSKRELRKLQKIVDRIAAYREAMTPLSDAALRNKTWNSGGAWRRAKPWMTCSPRHTPWCGRPAAVCWAWSISQHR